MLDDVEDRARHTGRKVGIVTRQAGEPTPPIRILLAEDHQTVREGLRLLIDRQADMGVVAEASTGGNALERCRELQPDVAIIDLVMPEMNGLDAVRAICQQAPAVAVVALTRYDDQAFVDELLSAGARGYVLKQSRSVELLNAIRAAARGQRYIDTALADRRPSRKPYLGMPIISQREETILRLLASGHRNKDIATSLGISIKTVEAHRYNGMFKLGLRDRRDVMRYAILRGWLEGPNTAANVQARS